MSTVVVAIIGGVVVLAIAAFFSYMDMGGKSKNTESSQNENEDKTKK